MQLGQAQLTREECQKRHQEGRCFTVVNRSPRQLLPSQESSGGEFKSGRQDHCPCSPSSKINSQYEMEVLIDSGADESLMDWNLARKLQIDCEPLARPIRAVMPLWACVGVV